MVVGSHGWRGRGIEWRERLVVVHGRPEIVPEVVQRLPDEGIGAARAAVNQVLIGSGKPCDSVDVESDDGAAGVRSAGTQRSVEPAKVSKMGAVRNGRHFEEAVEGQIRVPAEVLDKNHRPSDKRMCRAGRDSNGRP